MSLADSRAALVTALSDVEVVQGYNSRPTTPRAGDAWPLLGVMERAEGMAFYVSWRVLVFLPQDERAASAWIDANCLAIAAALESVGSVDRIEPVLLSADGNNQHALQITLRGD